MKERFSYESKDIITKGNKKTIRKVSVKNGKGFKMVSNYVNGKHIGSSKKPIMEDHIGLIKGGSFISGLFKDCKCENKSKTRKRISKL